MSDLTKLTASELVAHLDGREHAEMCGTCDYSKEAERRLERLEIAKSTAQAVQNELALTQEFLREAKERLEKCEAAQQKALAKITAAISAIKKGVVAEDVIWLLDAATVALEK